MFEYNAVVLKRYRVVQGEVCFVVANAKTLPRAKPRCDVSFGLTYYKLRLPKPTKTSHPASKSNSDHCIIIIIIIIIIKICALSSRPSPP